MSERKLKKFIVKVSQFSLPSQTRTGTLFFQLVSKLLLNVRKVVEEEPQRITMLWIKVITCISLIIVEHQLLKCMRIYSIETI